MPNRRQLKHGHRFDAVHIGSGDGVKLRQRDWFDIAAADISNTEAQLLAIPQLDAVRWAVVNELVAVFGDGAIQE